VAEHPSRFGLVAALPMPYVDEALDELAYAYDVLNADGVLLVPHADASYLGEPLYDPLFEELDRRRAVVLVHPMALPAAAAAAAVPYVLADFLLDTTRGALSLILSGALDRYPHISFILSHGGGFLPYAATRVEVLSHAFFGVDRRRIVEGLRRFYFDVALTGPSGLPSLLAAVEPDRILFGTDWCAVPADVVRGCVRAFDAAVDGPSRALIDRGNALALFPGVARRLAVPAA
jgi:predicted TIM-barrel fold metal-dependent hydrolase